MRGIHRVGFGCLMGVLAATSVGAGSGASNTDPFQDGHSKDVLGAMRNASTSGHPDQEGEFQGVLHFAKGDYVGAMKYFLIGAHYADKLSQLCIGLMYLNGNGVRKDPVTAYAWLAIAAERQYPKFVVTRDRVWATLNADQRRQATTLVATLSSEYGDAVAKPRMAAQLRQDMLAGTDSHLGYDDGRVKSYKPGSRFYGADATSACSTHSIGGAPISGCHDIFANDPLKPSEYFRARDAEWGGSGTVIVGPLQQAGTSQTSSALQGQKNTP